LGVESVANSEKKATARTAGAGIGSGTSIRNFIIGAVAIAVLVGGVLYWRTSSDAVQSPGEEKDPDHAELMQPGGLPDMSLGKPDAPNIIIEYASMTCPHCAQFEKTTFPELKAKYIDTGKVRFIFREFPLDGLALRASMLARCAGPDRYFAMIDGLFQTQQTWAVPGEEALDHLLQFARQAGFSKESFDKCLADKDMFQKIVDERQRAFDKFGVNSTPAFFVNGKRLASPQGLKDFEVAMGMTPTESTQGPASETSAKPEEMPQQPEATQQQPGEAPQQPEETPQP
jgi:protein-disulfide isomerase